MTAIADIIATMPGESTATDAEVLAWLQEEVTVYVAIPWTRYVVLLGGRGWYSTRLESVVADDGQDAADRRAADLLLSVLRSGQALAADDADVRGILQAAPSLPEGLKSDLVSAASLSVPRFSAASLRDYGGDDDSWLYHIAAARG